MLWERYSNGYMGRRAIALEPRQMKTCKPPLHIEGEETRTKVCTMLRRSFFMPRMRPVCPSLRRASSTISRTNSKTKTPHTYVCFESNLPWPTHGAFAKKDTPHTQQVARFSLSLPLSPPMYPIKIPFKLPFKNLHRSLLCLSLHLTPCMLGDARAHATR